MIEKLPIQGSHAFMSQDEIDKWYAILEHDYNTYLKAYDVSLPKKASSNGLWLIFLKKNQGKLVHKDTISTFVNSINPKSGKDQQVRHLSAKGWYILNARDKMPDEDSIVERGYHILITTEIPKPNFLWKALKRAGRISARNFDQLKAAYNFRCATCGSQEGKPHLLEQNQRTMLQQGHMNPRKALTLDNSIPQCQLCNQVYKDDYVFNEKGRVASVASPNPVLRADKEVIEEIRKALKSS
jgi:hypothetical protein